MHRARVAVAMSGGVDSSVACLLLKQEGYDVVGLTMKLLPNPPSFLTPRAPCCTLDMAEDAMRICHSLEIPHYTINLVDEFEEDVIVPFVKEYSAARTPNPCLECNRKMKFGHLLRKARDIGCEFISTGHYARVENGVAAGDHAELRSGEAMMPAAGPTERPFGPDAATSAMDSPGRALLFRAVDKAKDQSYALYPLTQDELAHSLFPLGKLTKEEVRKIARDAGLRTAEKPESQEICFVNTSYRDFLAERGIRVEPGLIVDTSGRAVGRHLGLPFYTVGQRKGLGVHAEEPLYVVDLDIEKNAVVVGKRSETYSSGCVVENLNVIASDFLSGPVQGTCMVRYRGKEVESTMEPLDGGLGQRGTAELPSRDGKSDLPSNVASGSAVVRFASPLFAVTPGQAAVLYQGDLVYAGGTIARRLDI